MITVLDHSCAVMAKNPKPIKGPGDYTILTYVVTYILMGYFIEKLFNGRQEFEQLKKFGSSSNECKNQATNEPIDMLTLTKMNKKLLENQV